MPSFQSVQESEDEDELVAVEIGNIVTTCSSTSSLFKTLPQQCQSTSQKGNFAMSFAHVVRLTLRTLK